MNEIFLFFACWGLLRTGYRVKDKKLWIGTALLALVIIIARIT